MSGHFLAGFTSARRRGFRATGAAVAVTVALGAVSTLVVLLVVRRAELQRFRARLDGDSAARTSLIERRLHECLTVTTALARLFTVAGSVPGWQFAEFSKPLVASQPGLQALEWIPAVPRSERRRVELEGREALGPTFGFVERGPGGKRTPAGDREVYYPVLYVQPIRGNEAAEGFDLGSSPTRLAALERARDTGEPVATRRVRLVQCTTDSYGFLVFVPVFGRPRPDTLAGRRASLRGFALAVYDCGGLMAPLIGSSAPVGLNFDLLDLSAPPDEQLLYRWSSRGDGARVWFPWAVAGHVEVVHRLVFAGRRWAMRYAPGSRYLAREYPWAYWLLLPAGLLATCLIARGQWSALARAARLKQEVAERTGSLLQHERTLRTLLDATDDVVVLASTEGTILVANDATARRLATPVAELEGAPSFPILAGELGETTVAGISAALLQGRTVRFEHARDDRTFETAVFPIGDADGRTIEYALYSRDVTEHRRLEREVAAQRDFAYHVMNAMGQGLTVTDREGRFEFVNPAYARMVGRAAEELIGLAPADVTAPESRQTLAEGHAARLRGETTSYECRLLRGDGSPVRTVITGVPMMRGGEVAGAVAVVTDLTERLQAEEELRESEDRYRALAETARDAIFVISADLRFEFANSAAAGMLGRTAESLVGKGLGEVFDATSAATAAAHIRSVVESGSPRQFDEELGFPAGRRWQNTWLVPLRNARGEVRSVQGIARDLTEQRNAETALRMSQRMETAGRLAGGIAHNLNNVFQALMSEAEALAGDGFGAMQSEDAVRSIREYVQRGGALTRQLLLFARSEPPQFETLDLNGVLRNFLGAVRCLVPENVTFADRVPERPLPVRGDRGQLEQVLVNLVTNAADAMPDGGTLSVTTVLAGGMAVLEVADTGCGMTSDVMARIFEPFFSTKEAHRGGGLGLSVVHGIVETHAGRIEVESAVGAGSTVRVLLPTAESGATPESPAEGPFTVGLPSGGGERILLVEDEEGARRGLEEILRGIGYVVVAVGSGGDATRLRVDQPFDVLLTDFLLPDITGVEVANELKERWPELRVILMSGYAEDETLRRAVSAGSMRFLQKPFGIAALARAIMK